ncbi:hypothetical protein BW14_08455 [Bifidobacterium sp. UTBIF-68]|uniref:SHOCT domain-containing protein n=1 Tax=Bifidobacterium sp. UTBIF-68 TaxID=1465262 RepID=UPI001C614621|nr:SHOCT domain-containing protein [Bifidobacterium sp. UTBIF-68]TPF92562.1 hypothetical protein BW14_08455 [Bifidobacterium sp. UTBIF-68]
METMEVKGYGATVTFDGETITINRTKFGNSIVGIEKTVIPMSSVVSVSLGKANLFINGLFCVSVMLPNGETSELYTSATQARLAPYSVIYTKQQSKDFAQLAEAVNACIPSNPTPIEHDQSNETSFAKQQAKLKEHQVAYEKRFPEGRRIQRFKGNDGTVIDLYEHQIWCNGEKRNLQGVIASVENGSALESRVTVTRLLLAGPFALAFKKKKGGEKYVTIEGPGFAWIAEADRKHVKEAVLFVNAVTNQVAKDTNEANDYMPSVSATTPTNVTPTMQAGDNIADNLAKLAQLHDAGILSDDEFDAAKKKALGL